MGKTIYNGVTSKYLQSHHQDLLDNPWVSSIMYSTANEEADIIDDCILVQFKDIDGTHYQAEVYDSMVLLYIMEFPNGGYTLCPYSEDSYKPGDFFAYLISLPPTIASLKPRPRI